MIDKLSPRPGIGTQSAGVLGLCALGKDQVTDMPGVGPVEPGWFGYTICISNGSHRSLPLTGSAPCGVGGVVVAAIVFPVFLCGNDGGGAQNQTCCNKQVVRVFHRRENLNWGAGE